MLRTAVNRTARLNTTLVARHPFNRAPSPFPSPLTHTHQVRDEKRTDYDAGRGGYGRAAMYQSVPEPAAEAPRAADPGA